MKYATDAMPLEPGHVCECICVGGGVYGSRCACVLLIITNNSLVSNRILVDGWESESWQRDAVAIVFYGYRMNSRYQSLSRCHQYVYKGRNLDKVQRSRLTFVDLLLMGCVFPNDVTIVKQDSLNILFIVYKTNGW